jgi:ubiquinone/menaquinone biosynthesis C-methylase UbiE
MTDTMGTATETDAAADAALKARHRAIWALGDYPDVAARIIPELGTVLVDACGVQAGDRVLDVAAGTGNVAIRAAQAGARVVASDLTPELLEAGRAQAAVQGVELEWRVADAEALPFADGEFDTVTSCVGVMFAPHHQASADEMVRVCRPGGTVGLISWTPAGIIGQLFVALRPYMPPPPAGAQPPPLWGDEQHVRELFGDRVSEVRASRRTLRVEAFTEPADFRDYFKTTYGPVMATYRAHAEDPERTAALDRDLVELARRFEQDGRTEWEYLLFTARRS